MTAARRRRVSKEDAATKYYCSAELVTGNVCGAPLVDTPSGTTCRHGHGGVDGWTQAEVDAHRAKWSAGLAGKKIVARKGDVLAVHYGGAKIGIGNYSTVEVDGSSFTRELREGEDVNEQFGLMYEFLRKRCEAEAREKIRFYSNEVSKGRGR